MKFSATRYPGDGEEDQIVIRMCPTNASILSELIGSGDSVIWFHDGSAPINDDPNSIMSGEALRELNEALDNQRRSVEVHCNETDNDHIDYHIVLGE